MPHLSPILVHDSLAFLSGQLGFDGQGRLADGIAAQTEQCLANIGATLAENGLDLGDVLKVTVFLVNAGDYAKFDSTYASCFGDHRPARSTVITGLAIEGALIEIEVVAAVKR